MDAPIASENVKPERKQQQRSIITQQKLLDAAIQAFSENDNKAKKKCKKKKKGEENMDVDGNEENKNSQNSDTPQMNGEKSKKFDWIAVMTKLIERKGPMKVKRLKKKVVNEFLTLHGDANAHKGRFELEAKVDKKLKKNKAFKVVKDTVSMAESRA